MSFITQLRPACVAVQVAIRNHQGQDGRICRLAVLFPDIGKPVLESIGFLRYAGERSFVAPEATEQELSLQPGLTVHL